MCSLFSSPVVWKKSRQQGVWSLITQEESAQLEAAMRTNQKSITIADEIVSKVSYILWHATMLYVCILLWAHQVATSFVFVVQHE